MKKTKVAFLTLALSALSLMLSMAMVLSLVACGPEKADDGGNTKCKHKWGDPVVTLAPTEEAKGSQKKTCTLCGLERTEDIPKLLPKYDVIFKDAAGTEISKNKVTYGQPITEIPANPTAPAGQTFYGWAEAANGHRVWNFDKADVNKITGETVLEPLFIKSGETRYLEAELCPSIIANGGMDGATYSGGQKGTGLIKKDFPGESDPTKSEYGSTCEIDPFYYTKVGSTVTIVEEGTPGAQKIDPKGGNYGYFVHYFYINGNKLVWNINVSEAAENVAVFGRFSAEYGISDPQTGELASSFTSDEVKVKVNGTVLNYGEITIHNIVDKECVTFEDFYLGSVNLKAGANTIEFLVDNTRTVNGTIASTSPCIDSIKLITNSTITWEEASLVNLGD